MYGLDLLDFFRRRHSWRKLHNLLARLPTSSAFVEAMANDPDYARQIASQTDLKPARPRLAEWTPELAALVDIKDRLAVVVSTIKAAAGGKADPVEPSPRPRTAIDRARQEQHMARHLSLVEEVKAAQQRWEQQRG